jgi:hypothetical protein
MKYQITNHESSYGKLAKQKNVKHKNGILPSSPKKKKKHYKSKTKNKKKSKHKTVTNSKVNEWLLMATDLRHTMKHRS